MAHKKSVITFVLALVVMAFISAGCERSYTDTIQEPQATPTTVFGTPLPSDMNDTLEHGQETATAIAQTEQAAAGTDGDATAVPTTQDATAVPEGGETSTATPSSDAAPSPTATVTAPVLDPTVAPSATPQVSDLPGTYTLKKGEFPYCIARRFNVDPNELLSLNGISTAQAEALQPGLSLKIPQSGATFPGNRAWHTHPVTYTLSQAQTVYGVACYFGDVDPAAILSQNPSITNPDLIPAGTSLQIP